MIILYIFHLQRSTRKFNKVRDYMNAYRDIQINNLLVDAVEARQKVKIYKSHRAPPLSDIQLVKWKPWGKKKVLKELASELINEQLRQQDLANLDSPYTSDVEDNVLDMDNYGEFQIEMVEQNEFIHDVDNL